MKALKSAGGSHETSLVTIVSPHQVLDRGLLQLRAPVPVAHCAYTKASAWSVSKIPTCHNNVMDMESAETLVLPVQG